MSVVRATLEGMRVTDGMTQQIPAANLRVRRVDFASVWAEGERILDNDQADTTDGGHGVRDRSGDWYVTGVVITCRWLACAVVPGLHDRMEPAWAPISYRTAAAHEELIEAETQIAERRLARWPQGMASQPGWLEAVQATLSWAWRGIGTPPLEIRRADAG
jgi:hypothetical protein